MDFLTILSISNVMLLLLVISIALYMEGWLGDVRDVEAPLHGLNVGVAVLEVSERMIVETSTFK